MTTFTLLPQLCSLVRGFSEVGGVSKLRKGIEEGGEATETEARGGEATRGKAGYNKMVNAAAARSGGLGAATKDKNAIDIAGAGSEDAATTEGEAETVEQRVDS